MEKTNLKVCLACGAVCDIDKSYCPECDCPLSHPNSYQEVSSSSEKDYWDELELQTRMLERLEKEEEDEKGYEEA